MNNTYNQIKLTPDQIDNICEKGVNPRKVYQIRLFWFRQRNIIGRALKE